MIKLIALLCCVFQFTNGQLLFEKKPDFLKSCRLTDPDFMKCNTESVQQLFDELVTGIDELKEIGTIDPMKINRIRILQGDGPVSVNASLTKVSITGFSKTKVRKNIFNKKNFHWETHIFLPKIRIEGNYHMQGRILVIPLNGRGKCVFEPSNMEIVMHTSVNLYEKYGHVFYNVTGAKVDYTLSGLKLRMDNLFDGVKALEDSTNIYLNENWQVVSEALKPIIANTIAEILVDLMQKVFHRLPGDYFVEDLPRKGAK